MHIIFSDANSLAGLELNPPKCVIVPLCDLDDDQVHKIKAWLLAHIGSWANFTIKPATKLLGFMLDLKLENSIGLSPWPNSRLESNAFTTIRPP